ncbi:hypothetical protein Q0Z83_066440 [Actinoplanes sichuanensis]|uniref:DUF4232 domain-containing protein n=1 Tax=Actinoplanes sichuanensis TaxID=512349 RepID=A0ABW4APU6_9ACTN|nr:DUF4232 domain-containing protein [Actinoplanes sichuanensis]BEL08453.1 hypothetical protein Q0Z83_066440 [Actinoplanes sichuanensis]
MRVLKTVVPGLLLLTALAACGSSGDSPSSSPTRPAPTPTGTTPATGATAAPTKSTGGSETSGKSTCRTEDVGVTITLQPNGTATTQRGLVAVTNTSKKACTVHGYLFLTLVNAADEPVDVPVKTVEEPGPPVAFEIKPGTTAFAGTKWAVCDKSDSDCGVGNTIRYSLAKATTGPAAKLDGFPAAEKSGITMKSLEIGSLQPATQGVVAW